MTLLSADSFFFRLEIVLSPSLIIVENHFWHHFWCHFNQHLVDWVKLKCSFCTASWTACTHSTLTMMPSVALDFALCEHSDAHYVIMNESAKFMVRGKYHLSTSRIHGARSHFVRLHLPGRYHLVQCRRQRPVRCKRGLSWDWTAALPSLPHYHSLLKRETLASATSLMVDMVSCCQHATCVKKEIGLIP